MDEMSKFINEAYQEHRIADLEVFDRGNFAVLLDNCGNPAYGQDADAPLPGTGSGKWGRARSLEHASKLCRQYIEENGLGNANWSGGIVRRDDVNVAYVSYNGRVWLSRAWDQAKSQPRPKG